MTLYSIGVVQLYDGRLQLFAWNGTSLLSRWQTNTANASPLLVA